MFRRKIKDLGALIQRNINRPDPVPTPPVDLLLILLAEDGGR